MFNGCDLWPPRCRDGLPNHDCSSLRDPCLCWAYTRPPLYPTSPLGFPLHPPPLAWVPITCVACRVLTSRLDASVKWLASLRFSPGRPSAALCSVTSWPAAADDFISSRQILFRGVSCQTCSYLPLLPHLLLFFKKRAHFAWVQPAITLHMMYHLLAAWHIPGRLSITPRPQEPDGDNQ